MGTSILGGPHWAIVEPSWNSTIEWICCCGCTTTSIRSKGTSKSRWASMTSSPLLTSVAEFVVMTRPHREVGVRQRLLRGDLGQRGPGPAPERPAARGDDETPHLGGPAAAQALRDGAVLGVDRHDLTGRRRGLDEGPADDERLLVREREGRAGGERRQGGAQPDRAGDPVEDDVGAAARGGGRGVVTDDDLRPVGGVLRRRRDGGAEVLDRPTGRDDERGASGGGLGGQERHVAAGRERDDAEAAGVGGDDLERLGADRAGGAEDGDGAEGHRSILTGDPERALPAPGHVVKMRSSMSRSETTRTAG